jgi:hypothetical protein
MKKRVICFVLLVMLGILPAPGKQRVSERDFGFGTMEIFQFKDATSYLTIRDLNGDGLEDVLFLDNKVSRLEVLIRLKSGTSKDGLPRLEERFVNKGFVLDQWAKTFQVADLNGDSRPDIVSIGDQSGLVIHFQVANGSFKEAASLYVKGVASLVNLALADLDGDGDSDILVCRKDDAEILLNNGKGDFKSNLPLAFSASGCQGAIAADVNGDKLKDLLFYFGAAKGSLRVRPGIGKGEFGWEQALLLPPVRSLRSIELGDEGKSHLAVILKNGIILRLYGFEQKTQGHLLDRVTVLPHRLPLMGVGRKDPPSWLVADFNDDGYSDFCVTAPLLSQVHLYMGSASGLQPVPRRFDSLSSIKSLKRTANGDLVVFSAAEKAIAVHRAKAPARFPLFFKVTGKPLAMTVGMPSAVFAVFKDKGYQLQLLDAEKPTAGPVQSFDLSLRNDPQEIRVFPLGAKNDWLVMLFMAYERPVVFRLKDNKLSPLQADHFRAMGLTLSANAVTEAGSKNNPALLISEGRVVRLYRWQGGKFQVRSQLNSGRKSARLSIACRFPDKNGKPGYLAYDEVEQDLIWFPASGKKRPVPVHFREGLKDITGLAPLRFKNRTGLILVGTSEVQWLQEKGTGLSLNIQGEYSSRGEDISLWAVFPVMLGSQGKKMLAMLDSNNRSVELVGIEGRELTEELVFEIFQDPGFHEPDSNYEPHSIATGDINGDNIRDMVVLVHDKLIIYLGE